MRRTLEVRAQTLLRSLVLGHVGAESQEESPEGQPVPVPAASPSPPNAAAGFQRTAESRVLELEQECSSPSRQCADWPAVREPFDSLRMQSRRSDPGSWWH